MLVSFCEVLDHLTPLDLEQLLKRNQLRGLKGNLFLPCKALLFVEQQAQHQVYLNCNVDSHDVCIKLVTLRLQVSFCSSGLLASNHFGILCFFFLFFYCAHSIPLNSVDKWDDLWNVTDSFSRVDFTRNLLHTDPCRH